MLLNNLQATPQHTLASVTGAMNKAATQDVRGDLFWPILKAMLDKGKAPSALAEGAEQQIQAWADQGAPRLDLDRDGNLDFAGNAIMDAAWNGLANAAMCSTLGNKLCNQLATRQGRFDSPNNGGGQYDGWYHYMAKDFSTELGTKVPQPYSRRYCGGGQRGEVLGGPVEGAERDRHVARGAAGAGPVGVARERVGADDPVQSAAAAADGLHQPAERHPAGDQLRVGARLGAALLGVRPP